MDVFLSVIFTTAFIHRGESRIVGDVGLVIKSCVQIGPSVLLTTEISFVCKAEEVEQGMGSCRHPPGSVTEGVISPWTHLQ